MWARTLLLLATAALAAAQTPTDLNPLRVNAERKTAEWFALHTALEDSLSRLLPCDARVVKTIDEVTKASDARLEAWSRYAAQWRTQTAGESQNFKRADAGLAAQTPILQAQKAQIESQIAELKTRRSSLPADSEASKPLDSLIELNTQRLEALGERMTTLESAKQSVAVLLSAADARTAAVTKEAGQWTEQASRWKAYYAARIARAKMECSITGQAAAPARPQTPTPQRKKQ